jgi:type IV pilus assembly protein PilO
MTNLQDVASANESRLQQRLLFGVPIAIGLLVTGLIVGFAVVPQWLQLQADSERLAQLEELQQRIPILRSQIAKTLVAQSKAERNQGQLLQMIQGSGELGTFLAQLDREATRLGVQLNFYEPLVALPPPPAEDQNAPKKAGEVPPLPKTGLEAAGLKAHKVLLTAKGPYPSLLEFLRSTEKLTVLVTQSDLALEAVELPNTPQPAAGQPGGALKAPPAVAKTELKLQFTYYRSAAVGATPPAAPKN